jgi:ATP-dependent protease ClpP protease subunit
MIKFDRDIQRIHVEKVARHFFINGPIDDPDDYLDLIDTLYQGQPLETVYIHLNTCGGSLDITMQIINAVRSSEALVVGIADGQVASAGSLLLFSCPNIAVQDFSYVMLHDGSEMALGKSNENLKQAQFTSNLLNKIAHSVYGPFFTEEEINSVLDGKDMWLSSEEVIERVKNIEKEEALAEIEV